MRRGSQSSGAEEPSVAPGRSKPPRVRAMGARSSPVHIPTLLRARMTGSSTCLAASGEPETSQKLGSVLPMKAAHGNHGGEGEDGEKEEG